MLLFLLVILFLFVYYIDSFVAVDALKPCKEDQCVPNCICDFLAADTCALNYRKYGWVNLSDDNLRPEVREQLNNGDHC